MSENFNPIRVWFSERDTRYHLDESCARWATDDVDWVDVSRDYFVRSKVGGRTLCFECETQLLTVGALHWWTET